MLKKLDTYEKLKECFLALFNDGVLGSEWIADAVIRKFRLNPEAMQKANAVRGEIAKFIRESSWNPEMKRMQLQRHGLALLESVQMPVYAVCYFVDDPSGMPSRIADFYTEDEIGYSDSTCLNGFLK